MVGYEDIIQSKPLAPQCLHVAPIILSRRRCFLLDKPWRLYLRFTVYFVGIRSAVIFGSFLLIVNAYKKVFVTG